MSGTERAEALGRLLAAEADYLRACGWAPSVRGGEVAWTKEYVALRQKDALAQERARERT
jgi:hypothetical protein